MRVKRIFTEMFDCKASQKRASSIASSYNLVQIISSAILYATPSI